MISGNRPKCKSLPFPQNPDFAGYTAISTKEQLNDIRNNLSGKYYLENDIELLNVDFAKGGAFHNNGDCWTSIGNKENKFNGIFDGNGFKISNLKVNMKEEAKGLFGFSSGIIKNLGLINIDMSNKSDDGYGYIGGITGYNEGVIKNCYYLGNIEPGLNNASKTDINYIGGITGYNEGNIISCYNTGDINILCTSWHSMISSGRGGTVINSTICSG